MNTRHGRAERGVESVVPDRCKPRLTSVIGHTWLEYLAGEPDTVLLQQAQKHIAREMRREHTPDRRVDERHHRADPQAHMLRPRRFLQPNDGRPERPERRRRDAHPRIGGEGGDFRLGIADRREALERDKPQFEAQRTRFEQAGGVAVQQPDLHEAHQMRKRLRGRHSGGGSQIAQ